MKTKKSKIVAILLLATLILTTNLSGDYVYANQDETNCIHNFEYYSGGIDYFDYGDDSYHYVSKDVTYRCIKCGEKILDTYDGIQLHSLNEKDWHSGTRHYYQKKCFTCGYSSTISWTCSGPPCVTPNRLNLSKD